MKVITIPFVGVKLPKITALGIVRFVRLARIGENGIVRPATNVLMVFHCLVMAVVAEVVFIFD